MDPAKLAQLISEAGPGVGTGLAAGLLFFILGLPAKKWVMWGRYQDMVDQRDKVEKRLEKQETEHKLELTELKTELRSTSVALDEMRLMVAAGVAISRKNAHLASSLMTKHVLPAAGDHDD